MRQELNIVSLLALVCVAVVVVLMPTKQVEQKKPISKAQKQIFKLESCEEPVTIPVNETRYYGFTKEEIDMIAQVVMNEASTESFDIKQGVAEVIINRKESNYKEFSYQTTIEEVIHAPNQWCTTNKYEPTKQCYEATYAAIEFNAFPDDMLWARANRVDYGYEYTIKKDSVTKFSHVLHHPVVG